MSVLKSLDEKVYMRSLVTEIINGESYSYYPLGQYVVRAMGVCGDRPTFKYTRIEIAGVMERLAKGENVENIVLGQLKYMELFLQCFKEDSSSFHRANRVILNARQTP